MTDKVLIRRAISSTFYVVLVFFILMGISFAWFSKNRTVTASGMSVEVQTSSNLVISTSTNFEGFQFAVNMTSDVRKLLPASHVPDLSTSPSGLQKPTDLTKIDYYSGLSPLSDLEMTAVPEDDHSQYYKDYTVFISCKGMALNNATLTAQIAAEDIPENTYRKAASIDFYLDTDGTAVYRGTLNLAGLDMETNHASPTGNPKTDLLIVNNGRIPCLQDQTGQTYLKIIMRCYFDGALQNTETTTFVNSAALDTTEFKLHVTFTANGTEEDPNSASA